MDGCTDELAAAPVAPASVVNTAGNRSHATRAQRAEAHDSLDDFPTPPWAVRALIEHVLAPLLGGVDALADRVVWEPACNRGHMALALQEYARRVEVSDVHDYGLGFPVHDFLFPRPAWMAAPDLIITNPPFRLAEAFALQALVQARLAVALLVRLQWLEGIGRYERLFRVDPPAVIAQFCERVPMVKGRVDPEAGTATAYAWVVWSKQAIGGGTRFVWVPPCRRALERAIDYTGAGGMDPAGMELLLLARAAFWPAFSATRP